MIPVVLMFAIGMVAAAAGRAIARREEHERESKALLPREPERRALPPAPSSASADPKAEKLRAMVKQAMSTGDPADYRMAAMYAEKNGMSETASALYEQAGRAPTSSRRYSALRAQMLRASSTNAPADYDRVAVMARALQRPDIADTATRTARGLRSQGIS